MDVRGIALALAALLVTPHLLFGGLNDFVGTWEGAGRSVSKLQIKVSDGQVRLHAFGACQPQDCDWGEVDAQAYATSVSANVAEMASAMTAQYETDFTRTTLVIFPGKGGAELRLDIFTVFTDKSGRSPYHAMTLMKRVKEP